MVLEDNTKAENTVVPDDDVTRHEGTASRIKNKRDAKKSKEILSWFMSIGIAVCAAFLIRAFIFEIIMVEGESMYPTLYTNERVAIEKVSRYGALPERGDIVIVKYPDMDGTYVKRVIGLPGEIVEVSGSTVYIDGVPLRENYINTEPYPDMAPVAVPADSVFVMGDNRAHSMDSRAPYIGAIDRQSIVGRGLFVIWPLNNIHSII